jgi:hypothetical protein
MRRRRPVSILNAYLFGFRSSAAVERLGKVPVRVQIDLGVYPPIPPPRALERLTPAERGKAIRKHYRTLYEQLRPLLPPNCKPSDRECRSCTCVLPASSLRALRRHPSVFSLWIIRCPGRIEQRPRPRREWYAVHARFALQVEGQRRGTQSYEDRTVLVRALSFDDAVNRLEVPFRKYGTPYLNVYNRLVRWRIEEVLDVYLIGEINLRDSNIEVYSTIRSRPLTRRTSWIPPKRR